ncbi:LysR family transcriptional regulator [Andreprevotia chitinilytica]|uniref:LysR family transcriptional regulator n=1 Tax=Andreprevotia chitinilytica TaxID=396808 RepID=UPI00068D9CEB|nr:LysR family transcriptional regulator [Andreprevotia chitinilytica]
MNNGLHEHLAVFVAIAQAGSLTGASIATGIGQGTISRQLAALEQHLGCPLFRRSTRAISLTERGEVYLEHALRILALTQEAEAAVQDGGSKLRGRIRVACSNGFGRRLLIPALAQWQRLHPEVHVELVLSDQVSQLIEERVDVAFRIAPLRESNLIARPVGPSRRIVVASPDYLKRHGPVTEPTHLQQHQCLLFSGTDHPGIWRFTDTSKGSLSVHVTGRLTLSTMDALYDAVLANLGIAVMPEWFWSRELLDGRVVQLLGNYPLPAHTIHAVTSSRPAAGGKVSTFISFVEQVLQQTSAMGTMPLS